MATMIKSGKDVVSFLKGQHQQVKSMMEDVSTRSGKERERAFFDLRRMLAVHEKHFDLRENVGTHEVANVPW